MFFLLVKVFNAGVFASNVQFQNYSTSEGLSDKQASCFYQDTNGFLWIGTNNGLNRFDGYSFKSFMVKPDDSLSLSGHIVYDIADDKRGNMLLSTDAGFFLFNPRDESFHKKSIEGMSNFYMVNFCFDDAGSLWGLTDLKTLIQIDTSTYKIRRRISLDTLFENRNAGINFALHFYDGRLWMGGSLGVTCYDFKLNKTSLVTTDIDPMFMYLRGMSHGAKEHTLVVVDGVRGVYEIDSRTLKCKRFSLEFFKKTRADVSTITGATHDKNGTLWVSYNNGLFSVGQDGNVQTIGAATGSTGDFVQAEPNDLFTDGDGNIWVGTMNDGVFAFHNKTNRFTRITVRKPGSKNVPVNFIIERGNTMYAGSKAGIFTVEKKSLPAELSASRFLDTAVHALDLDKDMNLLFFTNDIVYRCDKSGSIKELARMYLKYMHYGILDSRGIIWSAHWGWGLEGYDCNTSKRYKIDVVANDLQKNIVNTLYEDTDGSLWLATYGSGLVHVVNPATIQQKITIYDHKKDTNSLSNNIILSIHDDGRGGIWLGTNGGGLNRFNKKTREFEVFTTAEGLKSDVVYAIQSDLDGNIWFASTCMSKFDVEEKTFAHFDVADGVGSKYFTGATHRGSDGWLFFGDDQGILAFNPGDILVEREAREPVLTGFRLFGQPVDPRYVYGDIQPFPLAANHTSAIRLPHFLNTFSVEFASIQLLDNRNITYAYQVEGVDKRWIPMPFGERTVTFSGLSPGTYRFRVKALYGSGISSGERSIQIVITPPWWNTLLFRISLVFVLITLVSFVVYSRMMRIKKHNVMLEGMVQSRTRELQNANHTLSEQADTLHRQAETLSVQARSLQEHNSVLIEQKLFIEMKNKELNEAMEATERLISVIAHDFKNPLAAVYGLSLLLRDSVSQLDPDQIRKYSASIASATDSLRGHMVAALDWVQNKSRSMEALPVEINVETILDDAVELLRESANQKNIRITVQAEYQWNCFVDPRMASVVFRNLLTNAIKFTRRGGSIHVVIQELERFTEVSFIDTGVGIARERLQGLFFDAAETTDGTDTEKGTGVGLRLCKVFVEKNNGTISVASNLGEGSNFSVALPKGNTRATERRLAVASDEGSNHVVEKQAGRHSILIVDDDTEIIDLMYATFAREYNVIKAQDGKNGMFMALNMLPDLIVCDIAMPGIDGLELCSMLTHQPLTGHIPVLIVSSQRGSDMQQASYAAGATDFIEKPFNPHLLQQKVKSILEMKTKLGQQLRQQIESGETSDLPVDYNSKIINKVVKHIRENLSDENLDTNSIADKIGVSRSQLWRIFKSTTGKTLGDCIREFRMQKAIEMMHSGKFRVSDIAMEVGYVNAKYFIKTFTNHFGVSPTEYLEKMKVNN